MNISDRNATYQVWSKYVLEHRPYSISATDLKESDYAAIKEAQQTGLLFVVSRVK
jgi:hypothetical protein